MEVRETYDEWERRVRGEGRAEGRVEERAAVLFRLFQRKLGRTLTDEEDARLRERLDTLGSDRIEDLLLALDPAALRAWLADPTAR